MISNVIDKQLNKQQCQSEKKHFCFTICCKLFSPLRVSIDMFVLDFIICNLYFSSEIS